MLQINDKGIDASWELDIENSSITVNGTQLLLQNAKRQEFITKQSGPAYLINLQNSSLAEGEYLVEVVLLKGDDSRRYRATYNMKVVTISIFDYLYAIYEQRTS